MWVISFSEVCTRMTCQGSRPKCYPVAGGQSFPADWVTAKVGELTQSPEDGLILLPLPQLLLLSLHIGLYSSVHVKSCIGPARGSVTVKQGEHTWKFLSRLTSAYNNNSLRPNLSECINIYIQLVNIYEDFIMCQRLGYWVNSHKLGNCAKIKDTIKIHS